MSLCTVSWMLLISLRARTGGDILREPSHRCGLGSRCAYHSLEARFRGKGLRTGPRASDMRTPTPTRRGGNPRDHKVSLYAASLPVDQGKQVAYVTLPVNSRLHVFTMAVE